MNKSSISLDDNQNTGKRSRHTVEGQRCTRGRKLISCRIVYPHVRKTKQRQRHRPSSPLYTHANRTRNESRAAKHTFVQAGPRRHVQQPRLPLTPPPPPSSSVQYRRIRINAFVSPSPNSSTPVGGVIAYSCGTFAVPSASALTCPSVGGAGSTTASGARWLSSSSCRKWSSLSRGRFNDMARCTRSPQHRTRA